METDLRKLVDLFKLMDEIFATVLCYKNLIK